MSETRIQYPAQVRGVSSELLGHGCNRQLAEIVARYLAALSQLVVIRTKTNEVVTVESRVPVVRHRDYMMHLNIGVESIGLATVADSAEPA